ncbi:hypothetical protein Pyn_17265 [Prunus yedoensis var. nudiflora]|uniref:Uncharacterized protein n=1 Tax=Prunus yedoensis var. nudiflora TaxID=2094558 RepID=A0A314UIV1_PRUYE|nr:hypothetical protein Pyn_17265 [Prunus yedoensis var. nudiflora]
MTSKDKNLNPSQTFSKPWRDIPKCGADSKSNNTNAYCAAYQWPLNRHLLLLIRDCLLSLVWRLGAVVAGWLYRGTYRN